MSKGREQIDKALANAVLGQTVAAGKPPVLETSEITEAIRRSLGTAVESYNVTAMAKTLRSILQSEEQAPRGKDALETLIDMKKAGFLKDNEGELSSGVAAMAKTLIDDRGKEIAQVREEAKSANDRLLSLVVKVLDEGNKRDIRELTDKLEKLQGGTKSNLEQVIEDLVTKAVVQNIAPAMLGQQQPARAQTGIAGFVGQLQELQSAKDFLRKFFDDREEDPLMKLPEHLRNPILNPDTLRLILEDGVSRAKLAQEERRYDEERKSRERIMTQVEAIARQVAPAVIMALQNKGMNLGETGAEAHAAGPAQPQPAEV